MKLPFLAKHRVSRFVFSVGLWLRAEHLIYIDGSLKSVLQEPDAEFPKVFDDDFELCWQVMRMDQGPALLPQDQLIGLKEQLNGLGASVYYQNRSM